MLSVTPDFKKWMEVVRKTVHVYLPLIQDCLVSEENLRMTDGKKDWKLPIYTDV